MSEFSAGIDRFIVKVETLNRDVFTGSVDAGFDSITIGSPITNAPGQPVGQYGPGYNQGSVGGDLLASWQKWYPSPTEAMIATNKEYAQQEEDGISYAHGGVPAEHRSTVGGRHSVKLTVAGWQALVDDVTRRVVK